MQPEHCILLIEDNSDDAKLIERALRKTGTSWPIRVASDGDAAVEYLEGVGRFANRNANPLPTLVLLDLKLPRRSGFEVLDYVRAHPSLGKTIVIILTSSRESADIGKAYARGANSYLVKPIRPGDMEDLMSRVDRYWLDANQPPPVFSPPP